MQIRVHPDKETEADLRKAIKDAGGYCPCVPVSMRNEDTKCMCKVFREAPVNSICHCGLYIKLKN